MPRTVFGFCAGVMLGWLSVFLVGLVLLRDPFGQGAAPVVYPIERWRPGLALEDAEQQAAREKLAFKLLGTRDDRIVYLLGDRPATSLCFRRGRLESAWHSAPVNTALQAFRYLDRIAGRPPEATVGVRSFPDDSSPIWSLVITWPTDDGALMTARLTADNGSTRLGVTISAPTTECPT